MWGWDPTQDQNISAIMAPDEEEGEPASVKPDNAKLSPAMQQYQAALGQMPKSADYKPSRGRRIMAAIAGGFTGIKDPRLGVEVAQGIISDPYKHAMSDWQNTLGVAQAGMGIDKEAQAEEIARQRATAYGVSAQARQQAAQATEAYRQWQQAHQAWQPPTQEAYEHEQQLKNQQAMELEKMKSQTQLQVHPPRDYAAEEQARALAATQLEKQRAGAAMALENARAGHESSRQREHDARIARGAKEATPATPKNQEDAEQIAVQNLLRQNPSYRAFIRGGDVDSKDRQSPPLSSQISR